LPWKAKDAETPKATKTAISTALGKVWPLIEYAWRNGIDADAVDDATVAALQADLAARQIASPLATARNTVYGWEKLQAIVPAWPQKPLNRVYQDPSTASPHAIDFDDLPAPLRAAWDAYMAEVFADAQGDGIAWAKNQLAQMADQGAAVTDPFAAHLDRIRQDAQDDPDARVAETRKSGLTNFRTVFLYAANAAIDDLGLRPTTLAEIFVPDVLARVLSKRLERQRARAAARGETPPDPKNGTLKGTVAMFKAIARDIDQPEMTVTAIDSFYDVAHPDFLEWGKVNGQKVRLYKNCSMGPSHAAMLAQFDSDGGDRKLLAWFELPQVLHERVRARLRAVGGDPDKLSQADYCDAITAAVAAITRSCPLRRENVGELRIAYADAKGLGPNITIPNEPGRRGRIRLWAGEVKRGTDDVSVFLTPYATEIVRFYLRVIRPALARRLGADPQNPWLFPAYGMKHRALELITHHFAKRCADAGIYMDLHANRHLTAKIVLDRDINAMPLMQQILGHKRLGTTEKYYTDIKKAFVDAQFQAHLDAKEQEVRGDLLARVRKAS
jgi:integrase